MKITWLGHSAFRIETGASVILIDPFLSGNSRYKGTVEEAAQGCTHVLLTHGHDDHVGDTLEICKSTGATLVAPFELAEWLQGQGAEKVEDANPGGTVKCGDFDVTFTTAFHSSSTVVDGRPVYLGAACGLIVRAGGKTIYHMGDTEIFGNMALVQEMHRPQIGFAPIGGRYTMDAAQAAFACKKFFKFETIVPIHYGTFPALEQSPERFVSLMAGHNVRVPEIGAAFEV